MGWVPIHESGVDFTFYVNDGVPNAPTMSGSTIAYAAADTTNDPEWELVFTEPTESKVRIVSNEYIAGSFRSGSLYYPARISWDYADQENEAPPYPGLSFPNNDPVSAFFPSPLEIEAGIESIQYSPTRATSNFIVVDESYTFLIEVWQDDPPPPPEPEPCEEHGRVTRAYVSGYQRDRIHRSQLVRGERRCLVANFNGAIPPARTIARVIWRCDQNQAVYMENARIVREGREVAVDITAQIGWGARVKCEAVLDNGEVYTQLFVIRVVSPPYFMGEPTWYAQGPAELTATA